MASPIKLVDKIRHIHFSCNFSYKFSMNSNKHQIFAIVGPSGSGKSTLIIEMTKRFPHLRIVRSTSTRPRRGSEDDTFYTPLITKEEFETKERNGEFINWQNYAGNLYGTEAKLTQDLLQSHCGIMAMVESSVEVVRKSGISVRCIKIQSDVEHHRALERKVHDLRRSAIPLAFELEIVNSFQPGGLERSIHLLTDYFDRVLANHAN